MPADTVLEGYNSWSGGFYLNGHKLTVGGGGINIYENHGVPKIYGNGSLTSSSSNLKFLLHNTTHLRNGYVIESKIVDNGWRTVGLDISGGIPGHLSHVDLTGDESNTFTGDVWVSKLGGLQLYKRNGALAVRGNIYVSDGGYLILSGSNQIADSSRVQLDGRRRVSTLYFNYLFNENINEKISVLRVKGSGVIDFYVSLPVARPRGYRYLYLSDLEVSYDGYLTIRHWISDMDYILVRKDSPHLIDSLNRIKFEGHWEWKAGLKHYNNDYWQLIPGIPEPSTYGAVLGVAGLGLVMIRRGREIRGRIRCQNL